MTAAEPGVQFRLEAAVAETGVRVQLYVKSADMDSARASRWGGWDYAGTVVVKVSVWRELRAALERGARHGQVDVREREHRPQPLDERVKRRSPDDVAATGDMQADGPPPESWIEQAQRLLRKRQRQIQGQGKRKGGTT